MQIALPDLIKKDNKTHLVFDFDGTIAKLDIDWKLWHVGVSKIIQKFESDFIYEGGRMDLRINEFIKKYRDDLRDQVRSFNAFYEKENVTNITYNAPLIALINEHKNIKKYIYSSNSRYTVRPILKKLGIDNCFVKCLYLEDVTYRKPDPDGLKQIIDSKELPQEYLMIGDSEITDKGAADAVGIDFFLITMQK